jgi:anti-sigma28 factor (negative regulator of flagellin synthesis)
MFFNLLTLSVPGKTSWSNVRYAQSQKIEKHPGVTSGTLKVKRLKNIMESGTLKVNRLKNILE